MNIAENKRHSEFSIRRNILPRRRVSHAVGYLFLLPALILYSVFVVYPFFDMLRMPFFISERGLDPEIAWVGFANFSGAFQDERFWIALWNNLLWAVATIALPLVIGFVLSELLARGKIKGRNIYRGLLFVPQTLSPVVVGLAFIWIFQPRWGAINFLLENLGLEGLTQAWLGNPNTALLALILTGVWREFPFFLVIFLAAMQKIPTELYDAAKVDGANMWQEMRNITIPMIKQEVTFMLLLAIIISFKIFDIVRVMTRGGPFNKTEVLGHLIYQMGFSEFNFGHASAIGVILTAIIFVSTTVVLIYRERQD